MPTKRVVAGVALGAVCAALVNLGITTLARTVASAPEFIPLQPIAYVPYTVFGTVAGAVGWAVVRRGVERPARLLRWLVPTVVVLSFVPIVALFVLSGVGVVPVLALMTMHVSVATVAVSVYRRVLPLPTGEPAGPPAPAKPPAVVEAVSFGRAPARPTE